MAERIRMGKKDSVAKAFFRIPERFADTCNGILFDGRDVIMPSELSEVDIEYAYVNRKDNKSVVDLARRWTKCDVTIALIVLENQVNTDYSMVIRNMLSEALMYKRQLNDRVKMHEELKDLNSGSEFISGIKKDDKFTPVITIVIYFGKDKWDGEVYLHDMLNISDDIKKYVTNHRINLYDYHDYDNFSKFRTDVSLAFEAMSASKDRKKLKKIFSGVNGVIAPDAMRFVGSMLDMKNINKYITVNENGDEEEGHMCKALEDLFEDGRIEGLAEGRAEGQAMIDKLKEELAAAKAEIENLKLSKSGNS